jgi:hypothetical protein
MHKELGRFCREKQYSDRFEQLLIENKFDYKREFEVSNLQNEFQNLELYYERRLLSDAEISTWGKS